MYATLDFICTQSLGTLLLVRDLACIVVTVKFPLREAKNDCVNAKNKVN